MASWQGRAGFVSSKNENNATIVLKFLCGQMSVQFESGAWVKVNYQTVPMVPISTNFDTGKTIFFTFQNNHHFTGIFYEIDMHLFKF